jgi:predicted alpha-1,2-mannosidase
MLKKFSSLCLIIVFSTNMFSQKTGIKKEEVDFVNSYIGTAWDRGGGLIPMVGPPYAMTNFSAQTRENSISQMPYVYEDSTIMSFIATHQPMLWMGDYGEVSIMPQSNILNVLPSERMLPFSHDDETVSPYYYNVRLETPSKKHIKAEMAASSRCAIMSFKYPEDETPYIVVQATNLNDIPDPAPWRPNLNSRESRLNNVEAYIRVDRENNEITGYNPDHMSYDISPSMKNFKGYFVIQFDQPIDSLGVWNNDGRLPNKAELYSNKRLGAYVSFKDITNNTINVKVATSFISIEQARNNLRNEVAEHNLNSLSSQTKEKWQSNLSNIKVNGISENEKTIFYTALYRCLLFPTQLTEYGRYYSPHDDRIHSGVMYTDYSLWDTFRALHPLLIFIQPEKVDELITSMLNMYKQGGWLPMWPNPAETNVMIGTHADAVIADAYVKGFRGFDVELAYEAMRKNAFQPPKNDTYQPYYDRQPWSETDYEVRAGLTWYHSLGYIPADKTSESVSRTLEYALDDYCVAQMAKGLGKKDDYNRLMKWTQNYKNLYNPETGFMAPRKFNGEWYEDPNEGFTEGGPWTYLFCVMQDIPGMIELMGGNESFSKKLDENFEGGHYRHDNEPGHHYIYLYNYCGQPWKTQELVRQYTKNNYLNQPNGIFGNDDLGQMSAWYIFGTMGFYPVTSASGIYAIGAPQFPELELTYSVNGETRTLKIVAHNLSEENMYVQSVTLDKKTIKSPFISHEEIINGRNLVFEMGPKPNYNWK